MPSKIFSISKRLAVLPLLLLLASCSRDPEKAKRSYLDSGDKYLAKGKLKEASLMYRNAIRRDPRFGDAYFKLGEAELRRGEYAQAISALRRAIELLPNNPAPAARLADIFLGAYAGQQRRDERFLKEADEIADTLLKRDPKSYQGLRIKGFITSFRGDSPKALEYLRAANEVQPDQAELLFTLAQAHTAEDNFEEAEKIARRLIEKHKTYTPVYEFLLVQYMRRNRQDDAEKLLILKIQNNPKVSGFLIQQASFYRATQRLPKSEEILKSVLDRAADFPNGRMEVADYFMRLRDFDRALKLYDQGIAEGGPRKSEYALRKILGLSAQNRNGEALQTAEAILKENPDQAEARQARAALLLQAGSPVQIQQALTDLQQLQQKEPQNPVVRFNLARALQARSEWDAARVQYAEAIKLRPDFVAARLGLVRVLTMKEDYGRVISETDELLKLDPKNVGGRLIRINALLRTGSLPAARTELESAMKDLPGQSDLKYQMAGLLLAEKRFPEAEKALLQLRESNPKDLRPIAALAEVYSLTNRLDLALDTLKKEVDRLPDEPNLRGAYAELAAKNGRLPLAEAQLRKLMEIQPRNTLHHMRLSAVLRAQNRTQEALDIMLKTRQAAPDDVNAALETAICLEALNRAGEAIQLYEIVLKGNPYNPIALNNVAFRMAEDGRSLDTALAYAQRAKQQLPNNDDVADTLGWIYIKKNLSDDAITIFRNLTQRQPNNATFHYHLGMAYYQKGDKPRAKQSLQAALAKSPPKDVEQKVRELLSRVG
jgi:tetratricopeptide (TPR) repeat protein